MKSTDFGHTGWNITHRTHEASKYYAYSKFQRRSGLCFHGKLYEAQGNGDAEKVCGFY